MESLFSKDPTARPPLPPYAIERIQQEIEHLRKRSSVRSARAESLGPTRFFSAFALCALLWLYFMDPFLYAYHKGDAIRTYLYLHDHGNEQKAASLVSTGIFSEMEARYLSNQQGPFPEYFASPQEAEQTADAIIGYMNGLSDLRAGQYDRLDPIGKLRYLLFVRQGFLPPNSWDALSPSIIP